MRFIFTFLVLLILTVDVSSQCINPAQIDPNVVCPMNYDPVCGCNGVTYSNSCVAYYVGGVTSWTIGECGSSGNTCVNPTQIDSSVICTTNYDPVCGCDSVTYSNSCVAQFYGGVTSWTTGPCQSQIQLADSCTNLAGINFGVCSQFLGYGLINGVCSPISGCGTIVGNVDYAPAFSGSIESCQNGCMTIIDAPECSNLMNIDFGACAMPLGYGIINNNCQMISGCSSIVGNTDYSSSLYNSIDSCQLCLAGGINTIKEVLRIYPNATKNYFILEANEKLIGSHFQLLNAFGKLLFIGSIDNTINLVSVDQLSSGIYSLVILGENNMTYRLVKE